MKKGSTVSIIWAVDLFYLCFFNLITYVTYNFCGVCYTELTERERVTYGQQLFGEIS